MENKLLLTASEAAQALGISRSKLYSDLLGREDFPTVRLGGSIRINKKKLQAWIDARTGGTAQ